MAHLGTVHLAQAFVSGGQVPEHVQKCYFLWWQKKVSKLQIAGKDNKPKSVAQS